MKSKEEQELIIENIICFAGDNRMYFERKEYITKMMNAFKYYVIKEFKESLIERNAFSHIFSSK